MDDAVIVAVPDMAVHTRFFGLGAVDPPDDVFRRVNKLFEAGAAKRQHHFIRYIITRFIGGPLLCCVAGVLQADAYSKGLVNIVHHIIVQAAHIIAQPALVNRSDLLQHSHRALREAEERRDADMGRLAELLHPGGDGGDNDGRAETVPHIVLDHKDRPCPSLLGADHRV